MKKHIMPKALGYIWNDFCNYDNAINAIYKGTERKRGCRAVIRLLGDSAYYLKTGLHRLDPQKVELIAHSLVDLLSNHQWKPSPYRKLTRKCTSSGKVRDIECPVLYPDHFIHWMLILAIQEPLTRGMYSYCCGSIPNRGIDYARKAISTWCRDRDNFKYFVLLDIKKFFASIDHEILKQLFRRAIKDKDILHIIDMIIDSSENGLAIGNYTSQWFANFCLQSIDHYIKENLFKRRRGKKINYIKYYLRYMDDMLLVSSSKRDLEKSIHLIIAKLNTEFHLTIKPAWEIKEFDSVPNFYPVDMVGYRFYHNHIEMRKRVFLHAKRLAKKIYKKKQINGIIPCHDAQGMISLLGWGSHCNNENFTNKYINKYININELKGVISDESRKHNNANRSFCY